MSYSEAARWEPKDIKRIRRIPDKRPIPLPHKDARLFQLGHGVAFTMRDGSVIAVQGWCHAPSVNQFWAVVYKGHAFNGELRLVTVDGDNIRMSGERYRPDGKRAHADGSACQSYYPCKSCWEEVKAA